MRKQRRAVWRYLITLMALAVVCGLAAGAGLIVLSLPQSASALGEPSTSLDPIQRTFLSAFLTIRSSSLDAPAGDPAVRLTFEVTPGESAASVIERMQAARLVSDRFLFRSYLRYRGLDIGIQAGEYQLDGTMSIRQLAQVLQSAHAASGRVTIPEGLRMEQIAVLVSAQGSFSTADFLAASHVRPTGLSFAGELPEPPSVEGFLFPDTYDIAAKTTAAEMVNSMLADFDKRVDQAVRDGFASRGLSLYQAVTLASIVEREAVVAEERPTIASVFLNRLAQGMKLESDPTVQYALGRQPDGNWWKAPLGIEDLSVASPFNTYANPGLPPGPIANPGLASLRAVAFPADTPYLYFRALCDGSNRHAFAATYEEHLSNACP